MRYNTRSGQEPQHSSNGQAVAGGEGLSFEWMVEAGAEEEGHTMIESQSQHHRVLTTSMSSTSSHQVEAENSTQQNSARTCEQTLELMSPNTRRATQEMTDVLAESEIPTSIDPMSSLTAGFLAESPLVPLAPGPVSGHALRRYAAPSASDSLQGYSAYVQAPPATMRTPFMVSDHVGYGQQVFSRMPAPLEYSLWNTGYNHWVPQPDMDTLPTQMSFSDLEPMSNYYRWNPYRLPSLPPSPESEPAHMQYDRDESTPPWQQPSITATPRQRYEIDTSIRPSPTFATNSARRTRNNRAVNLSPSDRQPGKKPGDRNVPIWTEYPAPLTKLHSHLTLYEICQQYPNGLQWSNLDAFIQRRWSPSEIVKCMPEHCQDDVYGRKCIDKTMFMTKRIQKAEARLREKGLMDVLRNKAERGEFLREDGRPDASWLGPSLRSPRRAWLRRQKKKDGVVVKEGTEPDAGVADAEDEYETEVDDVEDVVEDDGEDAVGEDDTDYDYLASQGK